MRPVGRPKKYRILHADTPISYFSPRGKPGRPEEVIVSMDEVEAVRLADLSGLAQKDAAMQMRISQQTFSRILRKARRKLAEGLVKGRIIKFRGGVYVIDKRGLKTP